MKRTGVIPAPVSAGALGERKSELRQFVYETRDRLRMLSEQVARFQQGESEPGRTTGPDWSEDASIRSTPVTVAANSPKPTESPRVLESPRATQPPMDVAEPFTPSQQASLPAEVIPTTPAVDSGSDAPDDPLQRLSEIKKRLARQIENA